MEQKRVGYRHGGEIYDKKITLDLSANVNPLGLPKSSVQALLAALPRMSAYPDDECRRLTGLLSRWEQLPEEWILCGNGAGDLLFRAVQALRRLPQLSAGSSCSRVLLCDPCFSEYEKAVSAQLGGMGGFGSSEYERVFYPLKRENGFALDEGYLDAMKRVQPQLLILCSPNNPVGNSIELPLLLKILRLAEEQGCWVILDFCFLDFARLAEGAEIRSERVTGLQKEGVVRIAGDGLEASLLAQYSNLLICKAFTKLYGMAGLRLGYGLCQNRAWLQAMRQMGPDWAVSTAAQEAGAAALTDPEYLRKTALWIRTERDWLYRQLQACGLTVYPPAANFICFEASEQLYPYLLARGILIRQCANYRGLSEKYYRTAVRFRKENQQLVDTIREWMCPS